MVGLLQSTVQFFAKNRCKKAAEDLFVNGFIELMADEMGRVSVADVMSRKTCSTCRSSLCLKAACAAGSVVFVFRTPLSSQRAAFFTLSMIPISVAPWKGCCYIFH